MKNHKVILTVVITVLVLLIAGSGGYLIFKHFSNQESDQKYEAMASSYAKLTQEAASTAATTPAVPKNPVDFAALQASNPDIYSWINVPGTEVNYPVLQHSRNDNFYIDHDVDKQPSFAGAIYSQFCNKKDYTDRVTLLYGHNMADNSMFASLHSFEDEDFFRKHSVMTIYTPAKKLDYTIVSAFVFDDTHIMNSYKFSDDEIYRDFLDMVMHPHSISANVREGEELGVDDRIVILSTCLNYGEGRYLVVGKLTGESPLAAAQ